ncbi:MAG: AAA family ATPase, partial [Lachnospiraceae bacterium]|nr:AAA family ATPase [Lachnospiraceae bacterium]
MKIRELRIGHFGKLHNMTVRLDDGLNLIYGGNESGKSTLHAFIGAMLFGLDRNRGRAGRDDLYVRYQPWDTPGAYQGSMDFEHEGREYRITRVFYQKEKSCVLTDLETGKKLPLADDSITSLIPQLTKTAYYNTVSMGQLNLKCSEDFAGEVRNHIANLATTGGCRLNVEGALEGLYSRKKALSGALKNLDIEGLRGKEAELLEKEKEAAALIERRDASIEQAKPVREEIERLKAMIPETAALKAGWEQARAEADAALAAMLEAEKKENERHRRAEQDEEEAKLRAEKRKKLAGAGMGLLAVGGLLCVAGNGRSAILIGVGVVLLMISIVVLFSAYMAGKQAPGDVEDEAEQGDAGQGSDDDPEPVEIVHGSDEIEETQMTDCEQARKAYNIAGERVSEAAQRLEEAMVERERINGEILRLDETADGYEAAADRLEWEIENLGDIGNALNVCKHELMDAGQKESEIQKEIEAVTLAADTIREISEGLRDSFSASFNELLSEEICLATDGRYSAGRVNQNLEIEVMSGLDYVPAESLSTGTIQQLFAALRFASARLFFGDVKIPILLDECFAYSDEQRMRSALSALADREGQQILLFTCRKDEKAILDELGA